MPLPPNPSEIASNIQEQSSVLPSISELEYCASGELTKDPCKESEILIKDSVLDDRASNGESDVSSASLKSMMLLPPDVVSILYNDFSNQLIWSCYSVHNTRSIPALNQPLEAPFKPS